jgi:hypothetical protein
MFIEKNMNILFPTCQNILPLEIILIIIDNVDIVALGMLHSVNKAWNHLFMQSDVIWKRLLIVHFNEDRPSTLTDRNLFIEICLDLQRKALLYQEVYKENPIWASEHKALFFSRTGDIRRLSQQEIDDMDDWW